MNKRARIDCDGDACGQPECGSCWITAPAVANPLHPVDYVAMVSQLNETTVRALLSSLANTSYEAQLSIVAAYNSLQSMLQLQ